MNYRLTTSTDTTTRNFRSRTAPAKKAKAREMRKTPTVAEATLWRALRARQCGGLRWRRQITIVGYIADFYCPKAALVVEVDGSWHDGRAVQDAVRDNNLADSGFATMRITNRDVMENLAAVTAAIKDVQGWRVARRQIDPPRKRVPKRAA